MGRILGRFMHRKNRRNTRLIVHPQLQLKLIAGQLGILSVLLSLLLFRMEWVNSQLLNEIRTNSLDPNGALTQTLMSHHEQIDQLLIWSFVIVAILMIGVSLWITHRIAGPIRRLQNYFENLLNDPTKPVLPIHFRKGDFTDDLGETIGKALLAMKAGHSKSSSSDTDQIAQKKDSGEDAA